jgi:membrane-associated phospholipid phosphatase
MLTPAWVSAFDAAVGVPVHAMRTPVLTTFFYLCTLMANTGTIVFLTAVAIIVLALRRRFAEAILVFVVVAGGQALGTLVKNLVVRERPPASQALIPLPGSYAFPSGHALAAVLLYGVLAFLVARAAHTRTARIGVMAGAVVLVGLVGLSRVYLGVHWPSDVVAAWILGGLWLGGCIAGYVWWDGRHARISM